MVLSRFKLHITRHYKLKKKKTNSRYVLKEVGNQGREF